MNKDIDRKGGYNMLDKKVLLQITLILCLVTFVSDVFAEPISKKLSKNEELYPQGWSVGDQVKFKKNTVVMINDSGAVISGTLAMIHFYDHRVGSVLSMIIILFQRIRTEKIFSLVTIVIGITVIYIALLYQVMGTFVTKAELRFLSVQKGQ